MTYKNYTIISGATPQEAVRKLNELIRWDKENGDKPFNNQTTERRTILRGGNRGYRLSKEQRYLIATATTPRYQTAEDYGVNVNAVNRCIDEFRRTGGDMLEGTYEFGVCGGKQYSIEFKAQVASTPGEASAVGAQWGVSTHRVNKWREQLAMGEFDLG